MHKNCLLFVFSLVAMALTISLSINAAYAFQSTSIQPGAQQQDSSSLTTSASKPTQSAPKGTPKVTDSKLETITLGAGCFWCVEAVFQELEGVVSVKSGYSNGELPNPTYEQVCSGKTGHAEVCQIVFDPEKVSLGKILHVFWRTHDPTTLNRQGNDTGTQYRSGIYYHNEKQRQYAELYKKKLNDVGAFDDPVVTEIEPIKNFSIAEDYHQNYFKSNPNAGYCRAIIQPKVEKFREAFADVLKGEK